MSFKTAETTVSAAVASGETITFSYPDGTDAGTFSGSKGHTLWAAGLQSLFDYLTNFTIAFGASNLVVTYNGATTIPANTRVQIQLDILGSDDGEIATRLGTTKRSTVMTPMLISLGAPDTADADGVAASQGVSAAANFTINGALATGGVATFDVPRNVVAAWTTTSVLTITGTDEYGNAVVEVSASGTSHAGKKAFKTITSVSSSATITGATVGTGDVLGLPVRVPKAGLAVGELEDGANATAGTLVAAVDATATGTTGDVRGTYDPNSAANGTRNFELLAYVPNPDDRGVAQFAG